MTKEVTWHVIVFDRRAGLLLALMCSTRPERAQREKLEARRWRQGRLGLQLLLDVPTCQRLRATEVVQPNPSLYLYHARVLAPE